MSKKTDAIWAVINHSLLNAGGASIPTPGFETHKHLALSANEILMCLKIAKIYSESEISKNKVKELLKEAGIAVSLGAGLTVISTKVGHGVVNEMLNFVPIVGWAIKGTLAGSLTAAVGWAFIKFCEEKRYW